MNDFTAYRLYLAIKLHFSNEKYDVFMNRGKVARLTQENFSKKREAKWFHSLKKKFDSQKDYIQYLVACSAYGDSSDVFDIEKSFGHYERWVAFKQSSTYNITKELEEHDIEALLNGTPPLILSRVVAGKLGIEAAVAINRATKFTDREGILTDHLLLSKIALKIKKLDKFVSYDDAKIFELIPQKLVDPPQGLY